MTPTLMTHTAPPDFAPSIQLLAALWNLWQSLAQGGAARLREECGVDLKGFIALAYLQAQSYQSAELADAMQMPRYEVSRLLSDLERKGLIQRLRQQKDGRQVQVSLTAAGRTAWEKGLHTAENVTAPYLAGLDSAKQQELILTLAGLVPSPQHPQGEQT